MFRLLFSAPVTMRVPEPVQYTPINYTTQEEQVSDGTQSMSQNIVL